MFSPIDTDSMWLEDSLSRMKTGDLIVFKGTKYHTLFMGYFTHIGVVIRRGDTPYLFEANSPTEMTLKDHHNKAGIFCTPLKERVEKYIGTCWWKQLSPAAPDPQAIEEFVSYSLKYFEYELGVIRNAFKKKLGLESCHRKTNCGELTMLSLIKLGVLDVKRYDENCLNHLRWFANITKLDYGYEYLPLVQLKMVPFKY